MFRIIPASLLGLIAVFAAYRQNQGAELRNDTGIIFTELFVLILPVVLFIWILIKDFKDYWKGNKDWKSFIPSLTLFGLIIIAQGILNYYDNRRHSPSLVEGVTVYEQLSLDSRNEYCLDFKRNGKYNLTDRFGDYENMYYGTYTFKDSTLELDKKYMFGEFNIDKFLIRVFAKLNPYSFKRDTIYFAHLLPLDDNKKIVNCGFYFYDDKIETIDN